MKFNPLARNRPSVRRSQLIRGIALGLIVSTVAGAIAQILRAGSTPHELPPDAQPAVDTSMPAEVPHHFTEDLIVPGFTETGADVERQDDEDGRSPEGV